MINSFKIRLDIRIPNTLPVEMSSTARFGVAGDEIGGKNNTGKVCYHAAEVIEGTGTGSTLVLVFKSVY